MARSLSDFSRIPLLIANYPLSWSLIKAGLSRRLAKRVHIHVSRQAKRERGIWQHQIVG